MKERYSKLNTGLISATTGCPSQSRSFPLIWSQYCHGPISDTVAVTEGSCNMNVPLAKSKKCSSATSLARISVAAGLAADGGACVRVSGCVGAAFDLPLEPTTSLAIVDADSFH